MQCRNCRSELASTTRFCPTCGAAPAAAPAPTEPVEITPPATTPTTVASGRPASRSLVPIAMTVAVIAALVVGGFVVVSSGGGDDDARSGGTAGGTAPSEPTTETTTPSDPSTSATASTTTVDAATTTLAPTTTAETVPLDPNAAALDALTSTIDTDRPAVDGHLDRWVPQISAKREGLRWEGVDYGFPEILQLHRELDDRYGALLVSGGEYVFRIDDAPMIGWFITIVDESHPTPDGALEWCRVNSIDRNNCAAKLITRDQLVDATLVLQ